MRRLFLESDSDSDTGAVERHFNVKSLEVEWEGNPCYMHVFIDTTDILKLEEAKNNIKCQKIMFASVSHEFRTPLNAMINSYKFIDDNFKKVMAKIGATRQVQFLMDEQFKSHVDTITRFLKIGSSSAVLLLSLIEDILDLSKMEAGTFKINYRQFSLKELLEEVYELFYFQ